VAAECGLTRLKAARKENRHPKIKKAEEFIFGVTGFTSSPFECFSEMNHSQQCGRLVAVKTLEQTCRHFATAKSVKLAEMI
jgi:hypothetical protein